MMSTADGSAPVSSASARAELEKEYLSLLASSPAGPIGPNSIIEVKPAGVIEWRIGRVRNLPSLSDNELALLVKRKCARVKAGVDGARAESIQIPLDADHVRKASSKGLAESKAGSIAPGSEAKRESVAPEFPLEPVSAVLASVAVETPAQAPEPIAEPAEAAMDIAEPELKSAPAPEVHAPKRPITPTPEASDPAPKRHQPSPEPPAQPVDLLLLHAENERLHKRLSDMESQLVEARKAKEAAEKEAYEMAKKLGDVLLKVVDWAPAPVMVAPAATYVATPITPPSEREPVSLPREEQRPVDPPPAPRDPTPAPRHDPELKPRLQSHAPKQTPAPGARSPAPVRSESPAPKKRPAPRSASPPHSKRPTTRRSLPAPRPQPSPEKRLTFVDIITRDVEAALAKEPKPKTARAVDARLYTSMQAFVYRFNKERHGTTTVKIEPQDIDAFTKRFRKAYPDLYSGGIVFSDAEPEEEEESKGSETSSSPQNKTAASRTRDTSALPSFNEIIAKDIEAAVSKQGEPRPERSLDARFINGSLQSFAYQFNMTKYGWRSKIMEPEDSESYVKKFRKEFPQFYPQGLALSVASDSDSEDDERDMEDEERGKDSDVEVIEEDDDEGGQVGQTQAGSSTTRAKKIVVVGRALVRVLCRKNGKLATPKAGGLQSDAEDEEESSMDPDKISCMCQVNISDGAMLKCDFCGLHSHLPCAGYPDQNDEQIPSKFKCADCRSDEPLDLRQMRMKALARRALMKMKENGWETIRKTAADIGVELELGKSICHQVRDAGFLIPITSKGFNVGHDLVPWSKTQKKFQWFFKPAQVWIYTDNRKVTEDPNISNGVDEDLGTEEKVDKGKEKEAAEELPREQDEAVEEVIERHDGSRGQHDLSLTLADEPNLDNHEQPSDQPELTLPRTVQANGYVLPARQRPASLPLEAPQGPGRMSIGLAEHQGQAVLTQTPLPEPSTSSPQPASPNHAVEPLGPQLNYRALIRSDVENAWTKARQTMPTNLFVTPNSWDNMRNRATRFNQARSEPSVSTIKPANAIAFLEKIREKAPGIYPPNPVPPFIGAEEPLLAE